jgi:peptide/nickel transport system substrate-binding protein
MASLITIAQPRVVLDDPHACTDSGDVLCVFGALFDTLVKRGPAGGYLPSLATHWHVSDDARRFSFSLRDHARFHNGDPCEAEAVAWTLTRMARPDMGATLGAPGVYAQYLAGLEIRIVSRLEIEVTLAQPMADLFDILVAGNIVSPRAVMAAGDDLAARAVGTGPYILESHEPGSSITVRAMPGHFAGEPVHERITWVAAHTADERLAMLQDGRADIANGLEMAGKQMPAAMPGLTLLNYLAPTAIIFMFNAASGPGADARLRLALNLAIDREALVASVLRGAGQPLHGFVSPVHVGADTDAPPFRQDIGEARRLLREAGYGAGHGEGLVLQLYCPTRLPDEAQRLVARVAEQLAVLGVSFQIHLENDRTHYANQVRLKAIHDLCVFDSSPMSAFRVLHEKIDSRIRGSWWEGYCNPALEAILDRVRVTTDDVARGDLLRGCYRLLQQDPPWLYLYNHRRVIGVKGHHPDWRMRQDGVLDVRQLPAMA